MTVGRQLHVVVAGGGGFIGSHLCERLLDDGHLVTAVDNFVTGRECNLAGIAAHPRFRLLRHDAIDPLPGSALQSHPDRIYHLASPASPPGYKRHAVETLRVNSEGTRHLLALAADTGARLLYASTSEIYGDPLEHPQRESYRGNVSTTGPRAMYDEAKRFGEAMVMTYVNDYGVDARIVRIFNTYGPRSDPRDGRLIPNLVRQALMGEPLTIYGDGLQTRSLCYVSDLVSGLVAAMESPGAKGRAINLGNPEEHPVVEYARLVADLTGTTAPFVSVPPAVGDDPQRRRPDISRARALLGWEPVVGLREGLASTIEAFRLELGIAAQPVSLAATG